MNIPDCALRPPSCIEQPESALSQLPSLTLDLADLPHFDSQLHLLLPLLATLDDWQLHHLAVHARRLETCAFRLRGACVAEVRRRIKVRLSGGRGKRDTSGVGVGAQLARLAAQVGVSVSTLKLDARIHQVFFANKNDEVTDEAAQKRAVAETGFAREPGLADELTGHSEMNLAREFYVTALTAPDPLAAIRYAAEKRAATRDYSRESFRRDVSALKESTSPTLGTPLKVAPKPVTDLHVKIIPEARTALTELVNRSGQSPETIVAQALLAHHKTLTASATINTPATVATQSLRRERRANNISEPRMQPSLPVPSLFDEH
ncbi:MAG: hypothetical protein MSG64_12085 [Pyrinomonadaceae bacterium MAG19_C2-C3]|nr:hypothetical protein [Pyrinomonadaceae bacterium MAG19_C2-C3]